MQALVSPGDALSTAELVRYARQLSLPQLGVEGQRRLKASRVLVLGAGGLGAPVLTSLAAAGVGTIAIVDSDTVEPSNLQRQTLFTPADVGRPKAGAAAEALLEQNPFIQVVPLETRVTAANVLAIVKDYDVVVDGTDNFETRYLAHDAAKLLGKPYVWGSVLRFDGQVTVFWAAPPTGTGVTLRDLFPADAESAEGESCAVAGVLGSVCANIGAAMATETLKLLAGFGEPLLGRLLVHDGLDGSWREIRFGPAPTHQERIRGTIQASRALPEPDAVPTASVNVARVPLPVESDRRNGLARPERTDPMTEPTEPAASTEPAVSAESAVSPEQLRDLLAARERGETDFVLVDVREEWEREVVAIEGSVLIPMGNLLSDEARELMPQDERVILYCHYDSRSGSAQDYLSRNGWSDISFVSGGVDSWVAQIEPDKARY
jgi:molybdopterin/thiamine biosynthesis adenylyltransferase/rhodanese-related sulfurtransferase